MKDKLEILIKKIPRHGMSDKCQGKLPLIINQYLNGKPAEQLKKELNPMHRGFVDKIYSRLNWMIKRNSLDKVCKAVARHPEDLKKDPEFADIIITYCIKYSPRRNTLKKQISSIFNNLDREVKINLKRRYEINGRYKKGEKLNVHNELKILAKTQEFYIFILEEILNND